MKRLRNTSGIPDATVQSVVDWIAADLGIAGFDVECRNLDSVGIAGRAYSRGSGYHSSPRPFVVLRIAPETRKAFRYAPWDGTGENPLGRHGYDIQDGVMRAIAKIPAGTRRNWPHLSTPYQYAQHRGRKVVLATRLEGLVYLTAHELRHIWQSGGKKRTQRRGYYPNSRGRYSEVDTEAYALHMLRQWRKRTSQPEASPATNQER